MEEMEKYGLGDDDVTFIKELIAGPISSDVVSSQDGPISSDVVSSQDGSV